LEPKSGGNETCQSVTKKAMKANESKTRRGWTQLELSWNQQFALAWYETPITQPMLQCFFIYHARLKAVPRRWQTGKTRKVTLLSTLHVEFCWKQMKSSKRGQQLDKQRFWYTKKHIEETLRTKKPTSKQMNGFGAADRDWQDEISRVSTLHKNKRNPRREHSWSKSWNVRSHHGAGYEGMATTFTAAHHFIWRHL